MFSPPVIISVARTHRSQSKSNCNRWSTATIHFQRAVYQHKHDACDLRLAALLSASVTTLAPLVLAAGVSSSADSRGINDKDDDEHLSSLCPVRIHLQCDGLPWSSLAQQEQELVAARLQLAYNYVVYDKLPQKDFRLSRVRPSPEMDLISTFEEDGEVHTNGGSEE